MTAYYITSKKNPCNVESITQEKRDQVAPSVNGSWRVKTSIYGGGVSETSRPYWIGAVTPRTTLTMSPHNVVPQTEM